MIMEECSAQDRITVRIELSSFLPVCVSKHTNMRTSEAIFKVYFFVIFFLSRLHLSQMSCHWYISSWSTHTFVKFHLPLKSFSPANVCIWCVSCVINEAACGYNIHCVFHCVCLLSLSFFLFSSWVRSWSSISTRLWQITTPSQDGRLSLWLWTVYNRTYGLYLHQPPRLCWVYVKLYDVLSFR